MEGEPRKFRRGENTNRPLGGNVSLEPFPQALYCLALDRGYPSQLKLARALGKKRNSVVGNWYTGEAFPIVKEFAKLVVLLLPNDEKHDHLIDVYGQAIAEGLGRSGLTAGSEAAMLRGRKSIKPRSDTAYDLWLERFLEENKISFAAMTIATGLRVGSFRLYRSKYPSLNNFSAILQKFPAGLGLSPQQTDSLAEAVADTIEQALASGYHFMENIGPIAIRKAQEQIICPTYNGAQAARVLGITPQAVSLLRASYHLPMLLTEEDMDLLKKRPKRGRPKS